MRLLMQPLPDLALAYQRNKPLGYAITDRHRFCTFGIPNGIYFADLFGGEFCAEAA